MATAIGYGSGRRRHALGVLSWLPLVILPAAVAFSFAAGPPWVLMWRLAISIYAGLKWLTFAAARQAKDATWLHSLGYLLLWPGMDAETFLRPAKRQPTIQWFTALPAVTKVGCGVALLYGIAPQVAQRHLVLSGWVGMVGILLVLHFGVFQLLSIAWWWAGIHAPPIMDRPLLATSLADFWGRRWNRAFRDVAHQFAFRPLVGSLGAAGALLAAFLTSGIVHDLVISLPARAGFGLPTLYFLIQAAALLLERTATARRLGLARGWPGRLLTALVVLGPVTLLFHRPFVEQVILPTLVALRAM